jgi:tripartite-type tricarboxylate transporter receptor subunit TctC
MHRRNVLAGGMAGLLSPMFGSALSPAFAQPFPSHQIHVLVPSTAGGIHDVIARIWGERVNSDLGTVVIDDRGGGAGQIAVSGVANAQPDGYTLLLGSTSTIVMRVLEDSTKFVAAASLEPATIFSASSTSIVVNPKLPVKTVAEFIAYAKERPGQLTFGSGGTGAITHVAGEMFKLRTGVDILHVPYKGVAPAINDFLGGRIDVLFPNITAQILQMNDHNDLRLLSISAPARLEAAPKIPTTIEAGLPDFVAQLTFGLYAPPKTPLEIQQRIAKATEAGWSDKAFQKKMVESGFEPVLGVGPEKARQMMADDYKRWKPAIDAVRTQSTNK